MNSRLSENLTSDMYERHAGPLKTNYGGNSCFTIVTAEVFNHPSKYFYYLFLIKKTLQFYHVLQVALI